MTVCVPGAPQFDASVLGERSSNDMLISGTFDWYLNGRRRRFWKRSLLTADAAGSNYTNSYVSVITDDFVVGFKLKLLSSQ